MGPGAGLDRKKYLVPFAQGAGIRSTDGPGCKESLYGSSHSTVRDRQTTFMRQQMQVSCNFSKSSTREVRIKTNKNSNLLSPES